MKTVTVRIVGGLGNQLHCYAFGRALAAQAGATLRVDAESGYWSDPYGRVFLLDQFPGLSLQYRRYKRSRSKCRYPRSLHKLRVRFLAVCSRLMPPSLKMVVVEHKPARYQAEILQTRYLTNPYFIGYWASYRYYQGIERELREEMKPAVPTHRSALALLSEIQSVRSCFIHWRSYGEEKGVEHPSLNAYYRRAISAISERFPDIVFFVFSDDPAGARKEVASRNNRLVYVDLPAAEGNLRSMADFYLMYSCDHAIIGDSTFSWWAAWLGDREGKIVVAPTGLPWGGDWIPPNWVAMDIGGRRD